MDWTVLIMFLCGLGALVFGAETLVKHASALALKLGISALIVGLTIVAFGTGAPELAVGFYAAWTEHNNLLIGNVVGSNIANILLVLGIGAVLAPIAVNRQVLKLDAPVMIGASVLLCALAWDGQLSFIDGVLFILGLSLYLIYLFKTHKTDATEKTDTEQPSGRLITHILGITLGLILIIFGSQWLINSAVALAKAWGVSEAFIGLTIVAVGTSLPEIATTVMACLKGERDLAVGNVIGSCTFNILAVLGLSAMLSPSGITVSQEVLSIDLPILFLVSVGCLPLLFTNHILSRSEGVLFVGYYSLYTVYLINYEMQSPLVQWISTSFWLGLLPLTALFIFIFSFRYFRQTQTNSALENAA